MHAGNSPVMGTKWGGYTYQFGEGFVARIHFDAEVADETHHSGYTECLRVILFIPEDRVRQDGQPISVMECETLRTHERQLVDHLLAESVPCRLVGEMLYGGMFDLVFQVEAIGVGKFRAITSEWVKTASPYRIEIKHLEGWGFFDSKVRPSPEHRQQIEDRLVIEELIKAGSNPKARHQLDLKQVNLSR
jgi:hypothetical protein